MKAEASGLADAVGFRVELRHSFEGGVVEVRRYVWSQPLEQTIHALPHALVINMALSSRPAQTRVDSIAAAMPVHAGDAGRLLVMIPSRPYRLAAPSGSLRSLHCAFDCDRIEAITGEAVDWENIAQSVGELRPGHGIEPHLHQLHEELVRSNPGRGIAIQALADLICVELVRWLREGRHGRPDVRAGGLASWRMRKIMARIHADKPLPRLLELAELCDLTPRQLSRAFKTETGQTLGRFIDEVAMERAHRLLTTTRMPLAGIARELGFASADSFSQSFRRYTGTSPGRLRRPRNLASEIIPIR